MRDSAPAWGVWGHSPPENFRVLYPLRSFLVCFETQFCIQFHLFNRLYAKLIYANNRLTAKLKDIAASTKRLCTAFVYNSQGSNGVQNIKSKLFKHYKLLTKGRLAVRYAKTIHKSLTYLETAAVFDRSKINTTL